MKTRIAKSVGELMVLEQNGIALYWTPGAQRPYWGSYPQYVYDKCVATPHDFAEAAGYDVLEGDEDEVLEIEVVRPTGGVR